MKGSRTALAVVGLAGGALVASPALAQDTPEGAGGQEVELEEDPPPEDMEGTAENPDAPRLVGEEDDAPADDGTPAMLRTGYPIEEVPRPITLPATMSEVSLDLRTVADPVDLEIGLRARYGITRQWQIGLRYLVGGVYEDPEFTFNTGKAIGLDVTYLVFDWLAARVTVPVYVDPLGVGVTIGAPMRFRFGDKLALVALDDFIDIRAHEFVPSLLSEAANEGQVALVETNSTTARGNLHLRLGAIYQLSSQLAVRGNFTQTFIDFDSNGTNTGLEGLIQYSPSNKLDLVGRLGFDALDDAGSFGVVLAGVFRI